MSITRMMAASTANRIIKSSRDLCKNHMIHPVSWENGFNYFGQTIRLPEERFKEHVRDSSNCPLPEKTIVLDGLHANTRRPEMNRRDEKLSRDVMFVKSIIATGKFVSYDVLFMRGDISMTQEEFNAVKRHVK